MSTAMAVTIDRSRSNHKTSARRRTGTTNRRSGLRPGSSGKRPEALPEAVDAAVFGVLVELEQGGPGFLRELISEFGESVERKLDALQAAVRDGDTAALVFAAHGLRGSCGTVGARRMASLATFLEEQTPADAEDRAAVVGWIEAESVVVREWIAAEMARVGVAAAA